MEEDLAFLEGTNSARRPLGRGSRRFTWGENRTRLNIWTMTKKEKEDVVENWWGMAGAGSLGL